MEKELQLKLTVRLYTEDRTRCFGPGIATLLHRVEEHSSLRSAAASMEMAYSKAWRIIRTAETVFGCKMLSSSIGGKGGGGAVLTEEAKRLLAAYDAYVADVIGNPVQADGFSTYKLSGPVHDRGTLTDDGFNAGLKRLCQAHGALLVIDEVMTGFRVSSAGWYGLEGVAGDLYCFGKVMSGGLPAAAFGGRADVMAQLAPAGPGHYTFDPDLPTAGTWTLTVTVRLDEFTAGRLAEHADLARRWAGARR